MGKMGTVLQELTKGTLGIAHPTFRRTASTGRRIQSSSSSVHFDRNTPDCAMKF